MLHRGYAVERRDLIIAIDLRHDSVELRNLEHFVAVAEEHSFTRAAARVHLVQSALSVSIRSLERELGARLFDRTTHQVQLTDAGHALLVEARRTLAAADAARDAVAAVGGGLRGTVRIGIMRALSLIDLAGLVTTYHRQRPNVQLVPSTSPSGSAGLIRGVLDGQLDLAFVTLPSDYPAGLSVRHLAAEDMMLACPPDSTLAGRRSIALEQLDGQAFVEFPAGWGTRLSADRLFVEAGLRREIAVEVDDIPTAVELVLAGFGYAFLARSMVEGVRRLTLRRVRPSPQFTVSLITGNDWPPSAATKVFVDLVSATYPAARAPHRAR
jgi:DNA-binding transcriptional LysR family regulator